VVGAKAVKKKKVKAVTHGEPHVDIFRGGSAVEKERRILDWKKGPFNKRTLGGKKQPLAQKRGVSSRTRRRENKGSFTAKGGGGRFPGQFLQKKLEDDKKRRGGQIQSTHRKKGGGAFNRRNWTPLMSCQETRVTKREAPHGKLK